MSIQFSIVLHAFFRCQEPDAALKTTNNGIGAQRNQAYKGRGAALNLEGRFEKWQRESFED